MNVNEKIQKLKDVVDCDVEPDIYSGSKDRYITYTYEDERPALRGNNRTLADTAYLQISYFVPKEYDYIRDKHKIRDYLEKEGFLVTSIRGWVEDAHTGYQKIRHITFEVNYTEQRMEE